MKNILKLDDARFTPIKDLMQDKKTYADRRILVDQDLGDAESVNFGWCEFAPKTSFHKKHYHPHAEEICYLLYGKGLGGVGKGAEETEIVAGDTMWVPKGTVHWFYNPFDEPCAMVFLYTTPSLEKAGYEMIE